jgi:hypothetical protein
MSTRKWINNGSFYRNWKKMANNAINVATLDFETIKANLKNHLKSQAIFKDMDFEGSNIAVLIELLAYNTSLQSFYQNMLASESFLDSAQLRSSIISHAKELNYRPRSARSAQATIRLNVEQNNSNSLTIPKGTTFTSTYNFNTFTFSTSEVKVYFADLDQTTGTYKFQTDDIDIYEGFYVTETFEMDYSNEALRFILSNDMIDTSSLVVTSIEDGGSTLVNYSLSDTLLGLNSNSRNYFLQATEQEQYEILFGDDILGRRPADGAVITVQYRISSGSMPNGASMFAPDTDLTSDNSGRVTVTTVTKAVGGDDPETTSSIRFNAPRHFQTQQRAITTTDYETLLKTKFPEIDAISVYGGDLVNPPQYGKVFISLSVSGLEIIPTSKKQEYFDFIKPMMANPIQPVFVDPTFVYVRIDSAVKYNLNVTTLKPDEIRLLVANAITEFNIEHLNDFNATLYGSRLIRDIDDAHQSIISNDTNVYVYKKVLPKVGSAQNIDVNLGMRLRNDIPQLSSVHITKELKTVFSSPFNLNGESVIVEDDGAGGLRIMRPNDAGYTFVKNIGTVDYNTGRIQLVDFSCDSFDGQSIRFYALPSDSDVTSSFNDILKIDPAELNVTVETVRQ